MPSSYVTAIVDELAAWLSTKLDDDHSITISANALSAYFQTYMTSFGDAPVILSAIKPSYEAILYQLQAELATKQSWNEFSASGGGETLIEFVAALGAMLQTSIERANQENFPDTATSPAAIYLSAIRNGVRLTRKRPSRTRANLTYGSLAGATIPALTQFSVNGVPFFNRTAVVFPAGTTQVFDVDLYQGTIETDAKTSSGEPYQRFEIGNSDFAIADEDVYIKVGVGNQVYTRVTDGLAAHAATDYVFMDRTTQYGNVELEFGNGVFGRLPANAAVINFKYATTLGSRGNISQSHLSVNASDYPLLSGETTIQAEGGDDQRSPAYYRVVAPTIYARKGRAVTREDMEAAALEYPGVLDAVMLGQKDTKPNDVRYQNVVTAILLTETSWSDPTKAAFRAYMESLTYPYNYLLVPPEEITLNIEATVYCLPGVDLISAQNFLVQKILLHFRKRRGLLGFSRYRDDITNVLRDPTYKVDHVTLTTPSTDREIKNTAWIKLGTVTINTEYASRPELMD